MKGAFVGLSESVASTVNDCAFKCDNFPGCQGIAFSSAPASCLLLSAEHMRFIDVPGVQTVRADI